MTSDGKITTRVGVLTLALILVSTVAPAQSRYEQTGTGRITVSGTSTMHDWTMTSKDATYDVVLETNAQGDFLKLTSLTVTIPAESLKSGKGAMDKNAYAALKTDKNNLITFQLTSARIEGRTIDCTGKLTIAGATRQIDVEVTYAAVPGNSFQCKGSMKILMTDYNVEPPSFMFGSVTTGDEVTVSFDVILAPKKPQRAL